MAVIDTGRLLVVYAIYKKNQLAILSHFVFREILNIQILCLIVYSYAPE